MDGVSPFLLAQVALSGYAIVYWATHGCSFPKRWGWFLLWFSSFVAFGVASSIVFPSLFTGIQIYAPKGGIDEQYSTKAVLGFSLSNIAQALFLVLYWIQIIFLLNVKKINLLRTVVKTYFASGLVVLFFCFYQLLSVLTGVYYPREIISNNETYGLAAAGDTYSFLPRISSTLTEPSMFAMFMSAFSCWVYLRFLRAGSGYPRLRWALLLLAALVALLLSASTTGYLSFVVFLFAHTLISLFTAVGKGKRKAVMYLFGGIGAAMLAVYMFVPGADVILDAVLFEKGQSDSSIHRIAADQFAISILQETHYLGAGLGSTRPSSFVTFLLSNVGIVGFGFALMTGATSYWLGRVAAQVAPESTERREMHDAGWALVTMLVAKVLAGPELNFPPMWILFGYYILAVRRNFEKA